MNATEAKLISDKCKATHIPTEVKEILENITVAARRGEYNLRYVIRHSGTIEALEKLGYKILTAEQPFTITW